MNYHKTHWKCPNSHLGIFSWLLPYPTQFAFFDRTVSLENGKLTSTTGELAGSALDMATAVRNTVTHLKQPLAQALKMASLYPAQYLKLPATHGRLILGSPADFVQLNTQQQVISTWIGGARVC